jgi:hypothetical protein
MYSELEGMTQDTSLTPDKWTWGYKYNHAGVREQKRLLTSPHGEGEVIKNYEALAV